MTNASLPRVIDLVRDPLLADATVLAGTDGLQRSVRDVSCDPDDLRGAHGHLLVCGPETAAPAYRLDALIRRAETAGVSALLIISTEHPALSSIRLADRLAVPLLSVPSPNQPELLHRLTMRIRAPELVRARLIEEAARILPSQPSGERILSALAQLLSCPVGLLASDGTPILGEPVDAGTQLRFDLAVAQHADPTADRRLVVQPVIEPGASRATAWLTCTLPGADAERTHGSAAVLTVAAPFVLAWLIGRRAQADRDASARAQLLADVLAARDAVSRDVVERAVSLGWRLSDWHVGVHVSRSTSTDEDTEAATGRRLAELLGQRGFAVVAVVDRGDGWALWRSTTDEPAQGEGRHVLRAVQATLAALPDRSRLVAGIGRPYRGPDGLAQTLGEAHEAAYLAGTHDYRPAVEHVDQLGVARLLATWQQSDVLRAFAESALAPLRGADEPVLLATLHAYLEAGGSVGATADALGIHRNTVTARLHRLRERLGVDLDDPNQRLALQMACRTVDMPRPVR